MELPRIIHDELLHKLDEPHDQHIVNVRHAAEAALSPTTASTATTATDEHSPLLQSSHTPRGKHMVVVDVAKVEAILDAEEHDAIAADALLPAWTIVREESRLLLTLAIPMILAAMLEFLPEMVLTIMIGHVEPARSTQILAGFSLSNLVQMLLVAGLLNGLASAIDTLCSQAFGAKRMTELWLFCQAGFLMYAICMPFMLITLLSGSHVLKALGQDPGIADIAGSFLVINTLVVPAGAVFSVMKSALQAQNIVFPFVISSAVGWLVSGTVAYLLAFYTPLGYIGIALANPLCWCIKSLTLVPVILGNDVFQQSWPGWQPKAAMALVPKISTLGISSVLMMMFQMLGFSFISFLAGLLPNASIMIAANSIFGSLVALMFMPLLGICIGGAIRMGNALGAGRARRAALISHVVMTSTVAVSTIGMFVALAIATPYARAFTPNVDATAVAVDLMDKALPVIPLLGFTFGLQSIFRACGKQLLAAKFNFVCLLLLGLPCGLFFAIELDAGIVGLWYGKMAGMLVFLVAGLVWLYGLEWEALAHEAKHNTSIHFAKAAPAAS